MKIFANWKMNLLPVEVAEYCNLFNNTFKGLNSPKHLIGFAPQPFYLASLMEHFTPKNILIGAQNCSQYTSGAYTGELSPRGLKNFGVDFVIIGHSERRQFFGETQEILEQKVSSSLQENLIVIYCVGESLTERQNNLTEEKLKTQLNFLKHLDPSYFEKLIIAYEPIWAIGTGQVATPEMANETHRFILNYLQSINTQLTHIDIIYGGSVNNKNCESLALMSHIDGFLVGGASLKALDFCQLIELATQKDF